VLVTLGTHLPRFKEAMAEATRRAARSLPHVTFHFTDGNAGSARTETDANFTRYSYVLYNSAVRSYDLVVHHGGTGIVNTCLRDGVPALVHPVDYDQFDVAARIVHAGIARRLRSAGDLASNVAAALNDTALHDATRRFAEITARYNAAETIAEMVRDLKLA
jgi:UDP:flavonoid glycosyltransferase YjiC (YdhE family)